MPAQTEDLPQTVLESLIEPGMVVLDVGGGPSLPYRAPHASVIELDPSSESLAERISLPDASVDLVVAMYSFHHITAATPLETFNRRARALGEILRVLKLGGELLVFEVMPWSWAAWVQRQVWPAARRLLGQRLDAYFWGVDDFHDAYRTANSRTEPTVMSNYLAGKPLHLGVEVFGEMDVQTFGCSPFVTFPPALSLPWLRIPRFLYPFTPTLFRWRKEH